MKRYEGLFILNLAGREEGLKEVIDRITAEITAAGGTVETVQKMDKRNFARVSDKKVNSGYYANFIFAMEPGQTTQLPARFVLDDEVYRVLITAAPVTAAAASTP